MQNNITYFIGIDVSKSFFDTALMPVINYQKQAIETAHFENTEIGLKSFEKWLKKHKVSFDKNTVLVIENTGIYHRLLWAFCNKINLQIHIGNAAHIKWSFGIARGKNDKIDAIRLCKYACKESDELTMSQPLNQKLIQLKGTPREASDCTNTKEWDKKVEDAAFGESWFMLDCSKGIIITKLQKLRGNAEYVRYHEYIFK